MDVYELPPILTRQKDYIGLFNVAELAHSFLLFKNVPNSCFGNS